MKSIWIVRTALVYLALALSAFAQDESTSKPTSKNVTPPVPIYTPEAAFPAEARQRQISGSCIVSVIVDVAGSPQNARIVRCTDSIFADESIEAMRRYRFKAATKDGKRVAVMMTVEVNFRMFGPGNPPNVAVHAEFRSLEGITSKDPDSNGVYPASELFSTPNSLPSMSKFSDHRFGVHVMAACDIQITIDAKGKPSNANVIRCSPPDIEKAAEESLMKSKFKPAVLNGNPVAVRATVHLVESINPEKQR